jgi:hypothetical protein
VSNFEADGDGVLGTLESSISERMTARLVEAGLQRDAAERKAATIAERVRQVLGKLASESRKLDGRVPGITALMAVLEATLVTCTVLAHSDRI